MLKEAIEFAPQDPGAYCLHFAVIKPNRKVRPVTDFLILNKSVKKAKFKMETNKTILAAVNQYDWMFLIDLKDSYFQVSIYPDSQKYLMFVWKGMTYEFRAICFGLFTTL